jgi:hypothetical protein
MKFLLDKSPVDFTRKHKLYPDFIAGQLLTPLTRYKNAGVIYAIDNGAFTYFDAKGFSTLLEREKEHKDQCLFVTMPDVVRSGRRTLEIWKHGRDIVGDWPLALVAQDGIEDLEIPWNELSAVFIGGGDPWKDSCAVLDIVRTAKILKKHVHVGRVNTPQRFKIFNKAGADTCDGSGVAMYDHMLEKIISAVSGGEEPALFDKDSNHDG